MRRRELLTLLSGTTLIWPLAVHAQHPMSVIGYLSTGSAESDNIPSRLIAFRSGLTEMGYFEGRNVAIEYRWAEGQYDRLPALTTDLVNRLVSVIVAAGAPTVFAAKAATSTIPIVFTTGGDPVELGIVPSLSRPGGNVTGATFLGSMAGPKQIGLLRDLVPKLATIGLLVSPVSTSGADATTREVQTAAQAAGFKAGIVDLNSEHDIDAAFARLIEQRIDALVFTGIVFFNRYRDRLVALTTQHRIPAVFTNRVFPEAGGLMSYGADASDAYRQAGVYVGRILKGDKPADLPVMQATKFVFVINMRTVKALGLIVPPGLLAIADEVIE